MQAPSVLGVSPDSRRAVGVLGERLAEAHLRRAGYRVLERNFRTAAGEVDLVAAGHGCVVFCEVRARVGSGRLRPLGPGGPLESIGPSKRRQLRRMAREWLRSRAGGERVAARLRFDAVGVVVGRDGALVALEHVEDAF